MTKILFYVSSRHDISSDSNGDLNKDNSTNSNNNTHFKVHIYNNVCSNSINDTENASLEGLKNNFACTLSGYISSNINDISITTVINITRNVSRNSTGKIQMFDHMIAPILLYGSGVWGCENNDIVEKLHLKFCRMLLGENNKISKCMVYGELCRTPLQASIDQNVSLLNFWAKRVNANDKQFSKILYHGMLKLNKTGLIQSDWILHVQNCLNNCNLYNHWITLCVPNINQF